MYNVIENEGYDQKTNELVSSIVDHSKDRFTEEEQKELLGLLMEVGKNGFDTGVNCVCSFLSGINMI